MRVSVRLKGFWASALVASLAVVNTPTTTLGQNQFSPPTQSAGNPLTQVAATNTTDESAPVADDIVTVEARRTLLQARQALAQSDLETAAKLATAAEQLAVDFAAVGDSPATIKSLIERQNQLVEMASQRNPEYNAGAAAFFLTQAEALMSYQDFDRAEMLVGQARKFPVEFNEAIGNPDQLEKMIQLARAQSGTQATESTPTGGKAEVLKLMSQAQLAYDKGQYNEAKALVDDAKQLQVPNTEFADSEMQPWQMELKVQNAMNKLQFDPAAIEASMAQKDVGVVQANYDPKSDTTRTVPVGGEEDDSAESRFAPIPRTALEFYRAGMDALSQKKMDEGRNYLERAWANRSDLDPVTQQSIQDQLSRLTMQDKSIQFAAQASGTETDDIAAQDVEVFRQLQSEVFRDRAAAERLLQESPREALEQMAMIRSRIGQSPLDVKQQRPLLKMIDRDIDQVQAYIDQNLSEIENEETNKMRKDSVELRQQRRVDVGQQMQKLVEQYNRLNDEERYDEAEVVAKQAMDLDPESEIAVLLGTKATILRRDAMNRELGEIKEQGFWDSMHQVERASAGMNTAVPVQMGDAEDWKRRSQIRSRREDERRFSSESERRIWNTLKGETVQGEYRGTLAEAVDQLSRQSGVNIVFDELALAGQVQTDSPVDVPIRSPISLQSALEIILQQKGLVFVVQNEVIKVTTREASQSNLNTETYYIGDLVMPMAPPENPMRMEFIQPRMVGAMGGSMNVQNVSATTPRSQLAMAQQLGGNLPNNPFGDMNYNGYGDNRGPQMGQPTFATVGQKPLGGVTLQDFQPLINLIQNTIQPDSWQDTGQGLGTIQPYVSNLSLVVSQTQEVQDEIQDLLKKLRELNDVQIVVEVRFVTLQDNFFERVGIDFDFNINDNSGITDPTADTQSVGSRIVGRQPVETTPFTPTGDLDLQFLQGNFSAAEPLFGGFSAASAASFGFAILSDIEVFFLLQASKGNTRTNITQAPTVTMFNGQSANVNDSSQRPFVTSVIPVVGDFAVAHQPIITLLPDGTNLNVTAVVSADRQFVRLQLVPFFSQVTEVSTFTFDGSQKIERTSQSVLDDLLDIVDGGNGADPGDEELQTTTQGITVQLPVLASTTVSTVVSVPDGGTVLMGGIKRMREGRNESGVPFLSNLPYVNRLFKNVGIGHETQHLMMMVTPRIIIQTEIEEEQVGLTVGD